MYTIASDLGVLDYNSLDHNFCTGFFKLLLTYLDLLYGNSFTGIFRQQSQNKIL